MLGDGERTIVAGNIALGKGFPARRTNKLWWRWIVNVVCMIARVRVLLLLLVEGPDVFPKAGSTESMAAWKLLQLVGRVQTD